MPNMLRSDDWNYAAFASAKQRRPDASQAECLACHKPLLNTSCVFMLDRLTAMEKGK
jgi:Cytochrome P460